MWREGWIMGIDYAVEQLTSAVETLAGSDQPLANSEVLGGWQLAV